MVVSSDNTISSLPSSACSIQQSIYLMKISWYHYSHILLRRDVENVHVLTPDVLYKTICFLDQHIVCGVMVWSANIGVFMMTCSHSLRVFILNNVVMLFNHVYITSRALTHSITDKFIHISNVLVWKWILLGR